MRVPGLHFARITSFLLPDVEQITLFETFNEMLRGCPARMPAFPKRSESGDSGARYPPPMGRGRRPTYFSASREYGRNGGLVVDADALGPFPSAHSLAYVCSLCASCRWSHIVQSALSGERTTSPPISRSRPSHHSIIIELHLRISKTE